MFKVFNIKNIPDWLDEFNHVFSTFICNYINVEYMFYISLFLSLGQLYLLGFRQVQSPCKDHKPNVKFLSKYQYNTGLYFRPGSSIKGKAHD